jgi:hypothetical protein
MAPDNPVFDGIAHKIVKNGYHQAPVRLDDEVFRDIVLKKHPFFIYL